MTSRRIISVLALSATAVVAVPTAASAITIDVTTTMDVVDGADGVTSLREAMIEADANGTEDTIALAPDLTYDLTDCVVGPLVHGAGEDLTIDGNGATIAQTCTDERVIDKTGPNDATLTVTDVTLNGGPNTGVGVNGAAIRATSQLVLDEVTIIDVNGNFNGSVIEVGFGPAEFDLDVSSSFIDGNVGSALINTGGTTGFRVVDSTVTNHTGSGLLMADGSPIEVIGSTISGNGGFGISTSGQGDGLQPEITITDTTIADNGFGGVDCSQSCRSLVVSNSDFIDNGMASPPNRGGGIRVAIWGSGPATAVASVDISDSTFSGNVADHPGGGVYVDASFQLFGSLPSTAITNSQFDGNEATCAACHGGGLALDAGDLEISGSTFTGNATSGDGGGIWMERSGFDDFDGSTVFTMSDTTVSGNTAGDDGGGVYVHSGTQTITDSMIQDNDAALDGGGIVVGGNTPLEAGVAAIEGTTIAGNTSGGNGGGLWVGFPDGSEANLVNSTVTGNSAGVAGGGLASPALNRTTIEHVTLAGNTAPQGANLGFSGPVEIAASVITDPLGGGSNCGDLPGVLQAANVTTLGYSWASDATCDLGTDDVVDPGGDAELGTLSDNGGPTLTRLPAPTSPIVSVVPLASCTIADDQREVARPIGAGCEPGAVEVDGGSGAIEGGPGNDILFGTPSPDLIIGFGGADLLVGLDGDDELRGGAGPDVLIGGPGADTLIGGEGRDLLIGGEGPDVLEGGPGRDVLIGGPGDVLDGGPGQDLCWLAGSFFPTDC